MRKGFLLGLSEEDRKLGKEFGEKRGWSLSKTIRICFRATILTLSGKISTEEAIQKSVYMDDKDK